MLNEHFSLKFYVTFGEYTFKSILFHYKKLVFSYLLLMVKALNHIFQALAKKKTVFAIKEKMYLKSNLQSN